MSEAPHSFRLKVRLSPRARILDDEQRTKLWDVATGHVELCAAGDTPLKEANEIVVRCEHAGTAEDAESIGREVTNRFRLACVALRLGIYPSLIVSTGRAYQVVLDAIAQEHGAPARNDSYEFLTFPSDPKPLFVNVGTMTASFTARTSDLTESMAGLAKAPQHFDSREELAMDLFNTSFLESSPATRLLTLVMAVEALLEYRPRSADAIELVEGFLHSLNSSRVPDEEKQAIRSSLAYLRNESISAAGRRTVAERLPGRMYDQRTPARFFSDCYDARSKLVHGNRPPSYQELGTLAANLEVMVSDLILAAYRRAV